MAVEATVHVGDKGTKIKLRAKDAAEAVVDISGATQKDIVIRHPDGTETPYAGSFSDTGSDGWLEYTTPLSPEASKWTVKGLWKAKMDLDLPTWEGASTWIDIPVDP